MEIQKTLNSRSNLEKEEWNWRNQPAWLQALLQSHSHQDNMVLAQRQKYRPMEQNRKPRDKSTHISLFLRVTQESICWPFARSAVPEDISWRNAHTHVFKRSTKKLAISLFSKSGYLSSLRAAASSDGSALRHHFPHSSPVLPTSLSPNKLRESVCKREREREEREIPRYRG